MAFPADPPLTATALATAAISVALASLVWWRRLARLDQLRRQVAAIRQLSREIVHAPDAAGASARIEEGLRRILRNSSLKAAISLPGDGIQSGSIPQYPLKFPLFQDHPEKGLLLIGPETVMELPPDLREALADLAMHAALALEMREQRHLKEQVARGEQLAAASLLMAGIARELRPLLENLMEEGRRARLEAVAAEAESAIGLVDRLAALGQRELARPTVFDLTAAVRDLCGFRRHAWRLMQVEVRTNFPEQPMHIRAPRGLVEEALLGLLVALEQAQQEMPEPRMDIAASVRAGQAVLSLAFAAPPQPAALPTESIAASRSLLESCGAHFHEQRSAGEVRFEVRFPLHQSSPPQDARRQRPASSKPITALLVHPELEALRPVIAALAERGHRAVPAADAVQALEMAARLRFDAAFVSPLVRDLDWAEIAARLKAHVPVTGWLATASRPAPSGVPSLPLQPSSQSLEDLFALLEGTAGPPAPSISE
jgi:hypothetical protein